MISLERIFILVPGNADRKGANFEDLVEFVLELMGFSKFVKNVLELGRETDRRCEHKITKTPLRVECKYGKSPVVPTEFDLFARRVLREREKDPYLTGLLVSSCGFNSHVLAGYEIESDAFKKYFKLFSNKDILDTLIEKYIISIENLLLRLKFYTKEESISDIYLIYFEGVYYWAVILKEGSKIKCVMIFGAKGEILTPELQTEIHNKTDIKTIPLLKPDLKIKIITLLLNNDYTEDEIADKIQETPESVHLSLKLLSKEKMIKFNEVDKKISLTKTLETIIFLMQLFGKSQFVFNFMSSLYYNGVIDDPLIKHIEALFSLNLTPEEKQIMKKILLVSPSALRRLLFSDHTSYAYNYEHRTKIEKDPAKLEEYNSRMAQILIFHIVMDLINDLNYEHIELIKGFEENIKWFILGISICAGKIGGMFLTIYTNKVYDYEKTEKPLSAGSLVSPIRGIPFSNAELASFLASAGLLEAANRIASVVLNEQIDSSTEYSALITRANYERVKGNFHEALKLYQKAEEVASKIEVMEQKHVVYLNRSILYVDLYNSTKDDKYLGLAREDKIKVLELNPSLKEVFETEDFFAVIRE